MDDEDRAQLEIKGRAERRTQTKKGEAAVTSSSALDVVHTQRQRRGCQSVLPSAPPLDEGLREREKERERQRIRNGDVELGQNTIQWLFRVHQLSG